MHSKRFSYQINKFTSYKTFNINGDVRYILEARKRALAKKKKLRSLGKRAQSADSEDEMEVDGESDIYFKDQVYWSPTKDMSGIYENKFYFLQKTIFHFL